MPGAFVTAAHPVFFPVPSLESCVGTNHPTKWAIPHPGIPDTVVRPHEVHYPPKPNDSATIFLLLTEITLRSFSVHKEVEDCTQGVSFLDPPPDMPGLNAATLPPSSHACGPSSLA